MTVPDRRQLAARIDHTLLAATATSEQIRQLCRQAKEYEFCAVSVNPRWVALAAEELQGSGVKVGGVVSLPLGADSTKIKVAAAKEAIFAGADEIDMVADLAAVVEDDAGYLTRQLTAVLNVQDALHEAGAIGRREDDDDIAGPRLGPAGDAEACKG